MNKYYLALGGASPQVCTIDEIESLIRQGQARPDTKVCEVGASKWSTLRELLPQLFPNLPAAAPAAPLPGGGSEAMANFGKAVKNSLGRFAGVVWMFLRRIKARNFTSSHASPEEKKALESAVVPITSEVAQNYAAWRRAILWISSFGIAVAAISQLISTIKQTANQQEGSPGIMQVIIWGEQICLIAGPMFAILAAIRWTDARRSRRLAWIGWMTQFFGPFILLLLPARYFVSKDLGTGADIAVAIGMVFLAAFQLVPRIFGLFPGILRAGQTLRTLVPESPLPGWLCAVIAPFFMLLLSVVVIMTVQAGAWILFLALVFITLIPTMILLDTKNLSRPVTKDLMNAQMKRLGIKTNVLLAFGLAFLFISLSRMYTSLKELAHHEDPNLSQMGTALLDAISFWDILALIFGFVGHIFLVTVVFSDFFLALMRLAHNQDKALMDTPLFEEMDRRYEELAQMRLTEFGGARIGGLAAVAAVTPPAEVSGAPATPSTVTAAPGVTAPPPAPGPSTQVPGPPVEP